MIYYDRIMRKQILRPIIVIGIGLTLVLFSVGMTRSAPLLNQGTATSTALPFQVTITPEPEDLSEIGSTDGVVIMGFVTALIIIVPILAQRKAWAKIS